MMNNASTPFPLGVMVGGPNGSDPTAEAAVDVQFSTFTRLMGATPSFMDGFIDGNRPIDDWAANASWTAWSWRQSPIAQNVTPVIGLPMATGADQGRRDAVYQEFASGAHDAALRGVVQSWLAQGYSTLYFRPGYEMNGDYSQSYAGADAGTRADWVRAFQHISTVLRGVPGADVKIVWNPNVQAGNTGNVKDLYPGDSFVDVIAADIYNPIYPRDLYDWAKNDGTVDKTFAEWVANPINRIHYWTYPAANQWRPVSDGQSNTFSLQDMIDFAKLHGKPIGVAETGAGGDGTRAPKDDPAFPQWLASTLQNAGVPIAFVNIWDLDPGDGDWDFSSAHANKPLEAAAWAKYFGATTAAPAPPDTITLTVAEDAYLGDAQFSVTVDGIAVGGVRTATASHEAGQQQAIAIQGQFGTGPHTLGVTFLNDAWGGPGLDRNLYVESVAATGPAVAIGAGLFSNGSRAFYVPGASTAAATTADTLTLSLSQDAYGAPAQFIVSVDGKQLGGTRDVTASHGLHLSQDVTLKGSFGTGPHQVTVAFLNDAYGGSPGTDRNLYLDRLVFNGADAGVRAPLYSNGAVDVTVGAGTADTLTLNVSEDAWQGDAQFLLTLDGRQLGGVQTATASHALGLSQQLSFAGSFGPGAHAATVTFLNDAWGGGASMDRNLYVDGLALNGHAVAAKAGLYSNGSTTLAIPAATTLVTTAALDTISVLPA